MHQAKIIILYKQERIRVRSVQLPIYAMELSKTKLRCLACSKNFHIRKFLDSRTAILTSRFERQWLKTVPRVVVAVQLLSANPLSGVESPRLQGHGKTWNVILESGNWNLESDKYS